MSVVKLLYPVPPLDDEKAFEVICTIVVDGEGRAACETAFEIFNSYVDEMHCDRKYLGYVKSFRNLNKRSMSVGDVLDVDGVRFECMDMGFRKVAS